MIVLLPLVLCLFSNICFGMEDQKRDVQVWEIIDSHDFQDGFDHSSKKPISGKLQIYYARNYQDIYVPAARFIPDDASEPIIKFKYFSELGAEYCKKRYSRSKGYFERLRGVDLSLLMHIERSIHGNNYRKYLRAIVEHCNEPEELIDLPKFELWVNRNSVEIEDHQNRKYTIYNPGCVGNIKYTLSLNKSFRLILCEDKTFIEGKVIRYTNYSPIWWDGWIPSSKLSCIGMSTDLSVVDNKQPVPVYINLNIEKEILPHYQKIEWMEKGSMVAVATLLLLYYSKLNC
jgi:hypothetical protein